jgi:putative transposase
MRSELERKLMRRRGGEGEVRFLTISCEGRRGLLAERPAKRAVVDVFREVAELHRMAVHAWVLMPNHAHLLWTPLEGDGSDVLQWIKSQSAMRTAVLRPAGASLSLAGGGYDRLIWSWEAYRKCVEYIHWNPCHSRLARMPSDWTWSSAADWDIAQRSWTPKVRPPLFELRTLRPG